MRYRKTYGVKGLLEWKMTLTAGKAKVKIAFTGGSMGGNGVIAAKYVTDNAAIQHLMESSPHFRSGRVYLHGTPVEIASPPLPSRKENEMSQSEKSSCHEGECGGTGEAGLPDDGGEPGDYV